MINIMIMMTLHSLQIHPIVQHHLIMLQQFLKGGQHLNQSNSIGKKIFQ